MKKFSIVQRTQIVKFYYQNQGSIIQTQRAYQRHFNVRDAPNKNAIKGMVKRFEDQEAVSDLPRSGRPKAVCTNENKERIRENVEGNPTTFTRKRSLKLGISRTFSKRVMKSLNFYPYKVQLIQELTPQDFQPRLQYAVKLQELAKNEPNFFDKLIMSDEAQFHLNGFVKKQNCRFWAKENPRPMHQRELYPVKCTVWWQ